MNLHTANCIMLYLNVNTVVTRFMYKTKLKEESMCVCVWIYNNEQRRQAEDIVQLESITENSLLNNRKTVSIIGRAGSNIMNIM